MIDHQNNHMSQGQQIIHLHAGTLWVCSCVNINVKNLSVLHTVLGRHSHVSKTAKITVFDPMICKTPDAPLQDELLC